MPGQPSRTQVHVDAPLTSFAQAYVSQLGYVANRIPTVRVNKQGNKYHVFDKANWFRNTAGPRGPGAESVGGGFTVSQGTYFCDVMAFHSDVDDQTRKNADSPIDLDRDAARFVAQKIALKAEKQFAAAFIDASAWANSGAPSTVWGNIASTPIEDVRAQSLAIIENTGFKPNTMIVGGPVHAALVDHPDVLERIKYTQRGVTSADTLAALFEVDNYMVCYATENTTQEDVTASFDFVGGSGKNALLLHLNPNPSLISAPTALTRFQWGDMSVKTFRMEQNAADRIEGEDAYDMKVTGSDLGYEWTDAVS